MPKTQRARKNDTLEAIIRSSEGWNAFFGWSDVLWGWNEKMVFSFDLLIGWGVDFLLGGDVAPPCLFTK